MPKTDTESVHDDLLQSQEEHREAQRERLAERYGLDNPDDLTFQQTMSGWTAQWGEHAPEDPNETAPQQRFTPDQRPDPSLADASGLVPQQIPEGLMVDGVEGTGFVDWENDPLELDDDARSQIRGVGPRAIADKPYNFRGRASDWTDPDVGWTAQQAAARKNALADPQTKGLFATRVYTNAQLPDTTKYPAGWRPLPGFATGDRSPKFLTVVSDAEASNHPRGPEPVSAADRATKREAVKDRLNAAGVWAEVDANAGPDQSVAATGVTVTLSGSGTGPSGASLTYRWTQFGSAPAGTNVTLNTPNAATTTFTAPAANVTLGFTLEVTDTAATPNRKAYDDVIITVGTGGGTLTEPVRQVVRGQIEEVEEAQAADRDHPLIEGEQERQERAKTDDPAREMEENIETLQPDLVEELGEGEGEDERGDTEAAGAAGDDYESMSVAELRDLASERDIQGRSNMNKQELIEALRG